jgi:tetratricopeptide (TPR) repeat protein
MPELQAPDLHHLNAAEGWLELGNHHEALAELTQISPAEQGRLEVLGLRWSIAAQFKSWEECIQLATTIIELAPENVFGWVHRSFALHELRRTQEACDLLRPVAKQFPRNETIPYNLACYECQLGNLPEARKWFQQALTRSDPESIKQQALADADLQPLWPEILRLPIPE